MGGTWDATLIRIKFISHDGQETEVQTTAGTSVMRAAIDNGVSGIVAECGGACSCATCHVFVDEIWFRKLPEPGSMEQAMVEYAVGYNPEKSRLSCQLAVTEELDGLVLHTPESQD